MADSGEGEHAATENFQTVTLRLESENSATHQTDQAHPAAPLYTDVHSNGQHVRINGKISFEIESGDISEANEDVIVNSTSERIIPGGKLSDALAKKGGDQYKEACNGIAPIPQNRPCETAGFGLPCKIVLHCSVSPYNNEGMKAKLKKVYLDCLELANKKKTFQSMAFPAMGTGEKRYPMDVSIKALVKATTEFSQANPNSAINLVKLYIYEREEKSEDWEVLRFNIRMVGCRKTPDYLVLPHGVKLEVVLEDWGDFEADVLVCPVGGVMGPLENKAIKALISKFGESFKSECEKLIPFEGREVKMVETKEKRIILAYTSTRLVAMPPERLKDMIEKCLKKAEDLEASSIAFSRLGIGRYSYSPSQEARCFFQTCYEFASKHSTSRLKKMSYVVFPEDKDMKLGFEKMLEIDINYPVYPETARVRANGEQTMQAQVPGDWKRPLEETHAYALEHGGKEWLDVKKKLADEFKSYAKHIEVVEIRKIQNPFLYHLFAKKKDTVAHKLDLPPNKGFVDLWHGARAEDMEKIIHGTFDRGSSNISGRNSLGRGAHFSTSNRYNKDFSPPDKDGARHVFMVQVVTGEFQKGKPSLKVAPSKPPNQAELVDSVVDSMEAPTQYCVFSDFAAYPKYAIKYKIIGKCIIL